MARDINDSVCLGFGSWSDVNGLVTLGFGTGASAGSTQIGQAHLWLTETRRPRRRFPELVGDLVRADRRKRRRKKRRREEEWLLELT